MKNATSFKPGHPRLPNAGRKKGTPNKKTVEFQKILEEHDFSPAEALIQCHKDAREIFELRKKNGNWTGALVALDQAERSAEHLAQYVYPRKKAVEHTGEVGVRTFADFIAAGHEGKKE